MLTVRVAVVAVLAMIVAACGSALGGSDDVDSGLNQSDSTATTTTLPDAVIEDPPLPPAPDLNHDGSGPVIEDPPLPPAPPSTSAPDDSVDVSVYFVVEPTSGIKGTDVGCGLAAAVPRQVRSPAVLTGALEALLAGPTDEEVEAGYQTMLTREVGWELASVTIVEGTALIDFSEGSQPFNNMTASCVHLPLMAQLEATATQFASVDRAVFSVGGDIPTFYHWLERDVPEL